MFRNGDNTIGATTDDLYVNSPQKKLTKVGVSLRTPTSKTFLKTHQSPPP